MMMTPRHFPGEKRVKRLVLLALVLTGVSIAAPARGDYAAAVLADNPAAYWRMNEPVGAVAANDSSGNGGSGVYHNGVTLGVSGVLVEDPSNTASEYDGVNDGSGSAVGGSTDHFFCSPASLGSDYSVEFWFRNARPITGPGSLAIAGYVVGRDSGAAGQYDAIGIWGTAGFPFGRLYMFNGTTIVQDTTSTPTVPDVWYHVGMTRSGSDVNLYLNGNLEVSGTLLATYGASTQ